MSLIYKIFKLKTKSWIKNWIYNQEKAPAPVYPLSEIITGASPLTLLNSVRKKFNIFNISGNTKQQSYTGKNLFNPKTTILFWTENWQTSRVPSQSNDNSISIGEDNYLSGTSDKILILATPFTFVNGTTIYNVGYKGVRSFLIYNADGTYKTAVNTGDSYTPSEDFEGYIAVGINSNVDVTGQYIMYTTTQNATYEPYVGGIASPNPSYPQEIENVSGEVEVKVENKNLYNDTLEVGSINSSGENTVNTGQSRNHNYISLKSNTEYVVSTSVQCNVGLRFYDKNKTFLSAQSATASPRTFTMPENAYCLRIVLTTNNLTNSVQIEEGSTATSYEPHEEQTATLHLPEGMEMCKSAYGEHTDDFIKQGDKWYKYKQNVKKRLLATNVNSIGGIDSTKGFIVLTGITNKLNSTSLWCNYFTNISLAGGEDNSNKIGLANINTDETLRFRYKTGELTLAGAREFLTNNEVILQYRLKEPVLEEITDTTLISDLENLKNLYSYKGTTYISSVSVPSPVFEVQYYMEGGDV